MSQQKLGMAHRQAWKLTIWPFPESLPSPETWINIFLLSLLSLSCLVWILLPDFSPASRLTWKKASTFYYQVFLGSRTYSDDHPLISKSVQRNPSSFAVFRLPHFSSGFLSLYLWKDSRRTES